MANPKHSTLLSKLASELGVHSIVHSSPDTKILCLQRFIRLFAYGTSTLILVLYLSSLGISNGRIGLFMTLTLLGDVMISFLLTMFADGVGRRRILGAGGGLMAMSGIVFMLSGHYWVLVGASILGVISPSGNEIGPFRAIEESTLAQLEPSANRNDIFAWYGLIGTAGTATGTIICGWLVEELQRLNGWTPNRAYRVMFGVYAFLGLVKMCLSFLLTKNCEHIPPNKHEHPDSSEMNTLEAETLLSSDEASSPPPSPKPRKPLPASISKSPFSLSLTFPTIRPSTIPILLKLCLLFSLDSLASGLIPASWITYFFTRKFSLPASTLGTLFFTTALLSALSNLLACPLAKRIGLLRTMVFTHLPSALFLALVPLPSDRFLAMTFLALRACTQSMDQAPRQAFLAGAVGEGERTAVMGVVNVVKTGSQSVGMGASGGLAGGGVLWVAFLVAGGLKAGYDLGMLWLFLGARGRGSEEDEDEEGGEERG